MILSRRKCGGAEIMPSEIIGRWLHEPMPEPTPVPQERGPTAGLGEGLAWLHNYVPYTIHFDTKGC